MTDGPRVRRMLFMHPAHPMIGVSNCLAASRAWRPRPDSWPASVGEQPLRVSLVSGELNGDVVAALRWFQRLLRGGLGIDCRSAFVDVAEGLHELADLEPSDCTVLLCQGITILRDRSDWDPQWLGIGCSGRYDPRRAAIAASAAADGHPVLRGVEPFVSCSGLPAYPCVPEDADCLLLGQRGERSEPVAWAREDRGRRLFHTLLGCTADFRQPSFGRLLANALTWVARPAQ